jgi:hypothetical protein
MVPSWLHVLAILPLAAGFLCAAIIVVDELKDPQHMWIMNVVWPATALFTSVLTLWGYHRYAKLATMRRVHEAKQRDEEMPSKKQTPFPAMVGKGAMHCGSSCTLGDICAEWLAFGIPAVAV